MFTQIYLSISCFSCRPRTKNPRMPEHTYEKYLIAFDEHLLLPVCESSNLGCLSYKCGPTLVCKDCENRVTLTYTQKQSWRDAEVEIMKCDLCGCEEYDINQCLGQVCICTCRPFVKTNISRVCSLHLFVVCDITYL